VEVETAFATDDLVRRLERAIDAFAVAWVEGHASGDNPARIRLERFGDVVAAATPSRRDLDFMNRIHGLAFANPAVLVEVLSFYSLQGLRPWIELPPGAEELAAHLAEAGARPVESLAVLFGTAYARPSPPNVDIRRIGRAGARRFADLLLAGHGVSSDARAVDVPGIAAAGSRDELACYVAAVDGQDAAAGVLALHDGVGYLANASTLPEFRRRGCQTALVARRIVDSAALGCDLIASLTRFGSASQRTLERAGLRIAYIRTVWRLGEPSHS
jgi:ribosomal protein S18 acetylase RimI-like enzyme